jgi:ubiquinone/menaquinone biosynthesis C-methylase UbiE
VKLAQRTSSGPQIRAAAEALPFRDAAFDAAMAVLTLHHWTDWRLGVREMQRVASRVVVLTFDTEFEPAFWLFDYFPAILEHDGERMPALDELGGR